MPSSGTCGSDITWTLNAAGRLTLTGTGDMEDYPMSTNPPYNRDYVVSVAVGEGITSVGDRASQSALSLKA